MSTEAVNEGSETCCMGTASKNPVSPELAVLCFLSDWAWLPLGLPPGYLT